MFAKYRSADDCFLKIALILLTVKYLLTLEKECITQTEGFKMVCLAKPVLEAALGALKNLRGDELAENLDNRYFTIYICII